MSDYRYLIKELESVLYFARYIVTSRQESTVEVGKILTEKRIQVVKTIIWK